MDFSGREKKNIILLNRLYCSTNFIIKLLLKDNYTNLTGVLKSELILCLTIINTWFTVLILG